MNQSLRFRILSRDGFTCQYCGAGKDAVLEVDHIQPKSKGGADAWGNLITSCRPCNQGKRDSLLSEELIKVVRAGIPPEPMAEKIKRVVQQVIRPVYKWSEPKPCDCESCREADRPRPYVPGCACVCGCTAGRTDDGYCMNCYEDHCRTCGDEWTLGALTDEAADKYYEERESECVGCFEDRVGLILDRVE